MPSADPVHTTARTRRMAWLLSLTGLMPFVFATVLVVVDGPLSLNYELGLEILTTYGAVILSFLGGIRWGLALAGQGERDATWRLALSVLPSLLGWVVLLNVVSHGHVLLFFGFAMQFTWDWASYKRGEISAWFAKLRLLVSVIVLACFSVTLATTLLSV